MIKFETINGTLCRMVEPTPLMPDAEMPCLVRLIQDDSPMGKHNKDLHGFDPERLVPKICTEVVDVNDLSDPNRGSARCDGFMSIQYYRYELIGTHVKEGSDEWALHKMMNGEKICHKKSPSIMYCEHAGYIRREVRHNCVDHMSVSVWLNGADKNGWQIYAEPKPLLAEAKVGDLCQRRDGKWVQVDSYSNDRPCPVMCKSDIGGQDCFTLDGRNHNAVNNDKDIIFTEPLAPEGTKDWALQMMKLGKCVCHVKAPSIKYHRPTHYVKRVVRENCTDDMSDAVWMKGADPTGWQLYEPEQLKTMPVNEFADLLDAPIGWICKTRDGGSFPLKYIEVSPTRYAYEDKSGLTVYVMANGRYKKNGTDGRDIISCEHEQPKPESQYKVGDWVDCKDPVGVPTQCKVLEILEHNVIVECKTGHRWSLPHNNITRKISPSEIIVNIGCLSGTIAKSCNPNYFLMLHSRPLTDCNHSMIRFSAIDTQTRELVESLLEAMRGES